MKIYQTRCWSLRLLLFVGLDILKISKAKRRRWRWNMVIGKTGISKLSDCIFNGTCRRLDEKGVDRVYFHAISGEIYEIYLMLIIP